MSRRLTTVCTTSALMTASREAWVSAAIFATEETAAARAAALPAGGGVASTAHRHKSAQGRREIEFYGYGCAIQLPLISGTYVCASARL